MKTYFSIPFFVISSFVFGQGIKFEENPIFSTILEKAKKEKKLIFMDAFATWCGPCKMVAPILDELANEYNGQIYIYKVDVDAEPEIAAAYGIQSIPTIFFSAMTGNPQVSQGGMRKEDFKKMITDVLLKK